MDFLIHKQSILQDLAELVTVNQLVDLEWKFGVTSSSSEMWRVGNTFLQLKLIINKAGQHQDVYMELTLPQFYDFLHEMEKVRNHLEYLS